MRPSTVVNFASDTRTIRPNRGGYTLVEMLIASVLVAALMSVVWGMMSMSATKTTG